MSPLYIIFIIIACVYSYNGLAHHL